MGTLSAQVALTLDADETGHTIDIVTIELGVTRPRG